MEPLTDEQLAEIEAENERWGIPWSSARRLLAEVRRLHSALGSAFVEGQQLGYGQGVDAGLEEAAKLVEGWAIERTGVLTEPIARLAAAIREEKRG